MATVTVTAFQIGGFQFTGFQEAGTTGGGGDFPWFWMEMLSRWRAKREIEQKKKRKREEEEAEEAFAQEMTTLRFVPIQPKPAQPHPTALLKLLTRRPLIDEALELAEFREFMAFAELAQAALAKRPTVRRLAAAKPAHELPGLTEAGDRMVAVLTGFFKAQAPKIAHQIEQLKARFLKYSEDQPRDDHGRWTDTGAAKPEGKPRVGKPVAGKTTEVTGKQVIADKDGNAVVFYHGGANVPTSQLTTASYFTTDRPSANDYKEDSGGVLHSVYLDVRNPASAQDVMDAGNAIHPGISPGDPNMAWTLLKPSTEGGGRYAGAIIESLKTKGFDSVHFAHDVSPAGRDVKGGSWVVFDQSQIVWTGKAAKLLKAQMSDDEIAALNAVVAGLDFTGWATLAGDVDDIIGEVTKDGAYAALKLAGLDVTADKDVFNMVNEDALEYASKRSAEMVGMSRLKSGKLIQNPDAEWQITEGTRDLIRGTVGEALQGGWSTAYLADKLVEGAGFNADRAETIARTELIRANNTGTLNGFKSSGVVALKEWTTFDPCPICEANEDQGPIGLDETFDSGDDAPPAHVNCRCALVGYSDLAVSDLQAEE